MQQELPLHQEYVSLKPNSGHDNVATKKYHILAKCYDKKGRLLAAAFNSYTKTHPLQSPDSTITGKRRYRPKQIRPKQQSCA